MGKRSVEKERQWREIVARYERSGVKVRAFCHQEQIKESQFFAWKRELKRRDAARTANQDDRRRSSGSHPVGSTADRHAMSTRAAAITGPAAAFAPLHVVTTPPATPSSIEIIVADGWRVAVVPGFDPEALSQVLAVVEGRRC
jgi:hypothetical protein